MTVRFPKLDDNDNQIKDENNNPVYFGTTTKTKNLTLWVVGVDSVKYKRSTDTTWQTPSGTIYVPKGQTIQFETYKTPTNAPCWPENYPIWEDSATGTNTTASVDFNTISTSTSDTKKVTAKCGTSKKSVDVITYDFDSLTVKETAYTNNYITKPGSTESTLYVCHKPNNNTKITLSTNMSPNITSTSEMNYVLWSVEGNDANPSNGNFNGNSSEVTLIPSADLQHTFTVKAGLDINRNSTLEAGEVRETITVIVMSIKSFSITGQNQDGNFSSAYLPSDSEVCFSTDWGGSVKIKLGAVFYPNTPEVYSRACWTLNGDSTNKANGTYSNQPIEVTLSPLGNHEYTFKAGLDANYDGYLQTSEATHTIKIKILSVKVTPENAGGAVGTTPLTECMEGREITYTANIPSWTSFSENVKYKFCFKKANGTEDWNQIKYINANSVETTNVFSDYVSNSPSADANHHYFDTPVYVEATYKGVTATSNVKNIRVYRLYIMQFGDHAQSKHLKVCVGSNIEYEATASSDCQSWYWEMPDGVFNAWNISSNKKSGTDIKIPYSDLARASNSWFGDAYGSVYVQCYDGENTKYTFTGSKWIKVFFPPDVNVDGSTPTNDKPPCWFVFWKNGGVIENIGSFNFSQEELNGKYQNGQLYIGKTCLNKRTAIQLTRKVRSGYTSSTVTVTGNDEYIDAVAGTISHELYHQFTYTHTGTDDDGDMVTNSRENTPEKTHFPKTFIDDYDSYDLSSNIPGYSAYTRGDQEFRCRLENIHGKQSIDKSKDWAADNRNPLWK
ncbi:MAG: hypothetical protein LBP59_15045 [Planctomycetaceae bacterium]|jgi:hypothetical protein|nr:hypothetical protein [Planctomycetaceae bacterium]